MMAAASVAVAVERVGTSCTLPDSRSTWLCIVSTLAAVVGSPAILSTPLTPHHTIMIPPRLDGTARDSDGGARAERRAACAALVRRQVWHERAYSATSQSWPTPKARSSTSDPALANPKLSLPRREMSGTGEKVRGKLHGNAYVSLQPGLACRRAHYARPGPRAPPRPACGCAGAGQGSESSESSAGTFEAWT